MNAIVLTFDRLPASFLACSGNNWIETPNFDRLAARSATFHQHFAESLKLDTVRHAWWSGCYECRRAGQQNAAELLPDLLTAQGVTVRLLLESSSEDGQAAAELSRLFPKVTDIVTGADGLDVPPDNTPFLRLIARAQRDLRLLRTSRSEPWLLWIKSRGVPIPWLPPAEYARKFLDVDDDETDDPATDAPTDETEDGKRLDLEQPDEDGATLVEMSDSQFEDLLRAAASLPEGRARREARTDFDRALTRKVLGGYVSLLDAGLGRLIEAVDQSTAGAPILLIVAAAQGLTVYDTGILRDEWEQSADEIVHAPLFIRPADLNWGVRRQTLTQAPDLFATVLDWFGLESASGIEGQSLLPMIRGPEPSERRLLFAADGAAIRTVRSPDYYLVQKAAETNGEPVHKLFAKPEDAWEVNDLAAQTPELVEDLAAECDRFFGNRDSQIVR
jgi:arylsulfatase A-like enzyme